MGSLLHRSLLAIALVTALGALGVGCGSPSPTDGVPNTEDEVDGGVNTEDDAGTQLNDGGEALDGGADAGTEITIAVDGGANESPNGPPPNTELAPPEGSPDPCAADAKPQKGHLFRSILSAGGLRWYYLYVPQSYTPGKTQLVLNFHGYSSDPLQQAALSQMNAQADQRGFIVAYPAGINRAWNAGQCCGDPAWVTKIDDVKFVRDTIDAISREFCVDQKRVFSTGMSNGGFLSHRLACEASDRIAAIAPVAGVLGIPFCNPPRNVPVLHFHGTNDALVPYYGGSTLGFPSVPVTVAGWELRNGCSGLPKPTYSQGEVTCVARPGCPANGETVHCKVDGGGHTWPGGTPVPVLGHTTSDIVATEAMLDFFEQHPMP